MKLNANAFRLVPAVLLAALLGLLALAGCSSQPLELTGVFPADGSAGVPEDTAVELTFSAPPGPLEDYFTVEPPLEGRWEVFGNTAAFLPTGEGENSWQPGTTYTLTVKAGARSAQGRGVLAEDRSFSFTILEEEAPYYTVEREAETFLPEDYPVVDLFIMNFYNNEDADLSRDFSVSVHRLPDGESYLQHLYKTMVTDTGVRVDTAGLPEVLTFTQGQEEAAGNSRGRTADIVFPQTLEAGWYVATVRPEGDAPAVQKLLQIQPSAVYTQTSGENVLLWFNSTDTGEAIPGVTVEIRKDPFDAGAGSFSFEADGNGIAAFQLPEMPQGDYYDAEDRWNLFDGRIRYFYTAAAADGTLYCDYLIPYTTGSDALRQDYYTFLYTDRAVYRRDDTVKFWGIARPRRDAQPLETVEVSFFHNGGEPIETLTLPVGEDGIYTGELSYQGLASGTLEVAVYPGGSQWEEESYTPSLSVEYLSVSQYKKPIYTGSLSADKLYYQPGETIRADLSVTLFDRTPAAGVNMLLSAPNSNQLSLDTDAAGEIRVEYPAAAPADSWTTDWRPREFTITAENGDASDVDLSISETVYVFPTTVMLEAEALDRPDGSDLSVSVHSIDFSQVPGGRQVIQDYDLLRGAPAQAEVTVDLWKVAYIETQLEPYYDRYTKTTVPRSAFERQETLEGSFTGVTGADGTLVFRDLCPAPEEHVYYYAEITTFQGGTQTVTVSLGENRYFEPTGQAGHYHTFYVDNGDPSLDIPGKGNAFYGASQFDFGQEITWQVLDNGVPVEEGRVMTNLLQGGFLRGGQLEGTSGTILCGEETLPNFTLCGAYFDGRRIYPVNPRSLSVDPESRSLSLEILPDREDYRPGETAGVTLRLTDEAGEPVPGASLALGVVDEAIFAIREQYVQLGEDLYRDVFYDFPDVRASYVQHGVSIGYGEGGKGGGGGGDGLTVRENFKDTIDLYTGVTGADGTASFRVEMPDSLTQWRLTALAVDGDTYWGQSRSSLYTTLPFRIDPILSETFLTGDTIACTVRGFGTAISTGDPVEYTASIEGYEEPLEVSAGAAAGETASLVFRKLPAGSYTMTVTARCGAYSDGVKLPFTVQESALLFPVHETADLTQGGLEGISPALWPAEVTIYNQGREAFFQAWDLIAGDQSGRADAKLALEAVRGPITAFFGEGYEHPDPDLSEAQTGLADAKGEHGGVAPYPYAGPDVQVSARAAVAAADLLNRSDLAYYLRRSYEETSSSLERAAALMGLAALGDLSEDEALVLQTRAQAGGLPVRELEYLIAGLSYLDPQEAQSLYSRQLAPLLTEGRGGLCITQETAYDTVDATAGALACAILTGATDDARAMVGYLSQNDTTPYGTTRGPCALEAALYLCRFQLTEEELSTVRYTLDGEERTASIPRNGCLTLTLTEEEFSALDLTLEKGAASAEVWYTAALEDLDFSPSSRVTVTKTMDTPEDQKHLGGETSVALRVDLDPAMPYGAYRLVEWVPSNMRLRGVEEDPESSVPFSWESEGQLLSVDFWYGEDTGASFTFRYTATSVLDTECALERAYAYCQDTMEGGWTEKGDFLPSAYYYLGVGYLFRQE